MAEERLSEIRELRLAKRAKLIKDGKDPYPAEARRTHAIARLLEQFDDIARNEEVVVLTGRVVSVRSHGGVVFMDLKDNSDKIQLQVTKESISLDFFDQLENLDVGDFIQVSGKAIVTSRGVNTLQLDEWHFLAKSINPLPSNWHGFKDHEQRYRVREVDVLQNENVRKTLEMRTNIIAWLRNHLKNLGYVEFETPILQTLAGGASAKPFKTHHNALDIELYLRVSAELHLKRMLVAGFERVFEIDRRFRNEGIDRQHNPEFTMLESQWAYADYEDLMDFTEDTIEAMCLDLKKTTELTWQGTDLSFKKPFKRVRFVDLVSDKLGIDILENKDPKSFLELFQKHNLEVPEVETYYQMVDELFKELIRPHIIQPTLLYDYPSEFSPLAKASRQDDRVVERMQLLINGLEMNTCYTEQNDPVLQREALEESQKNKGLGDEEAHQVDEEYIRAMEYGMPPNAGWSLGIDRMVMLLTDSPSVRDTIAFPLMKPGQ